MAICAKSAIEIIRILNAAGVEAWVDGGWGVDALVGEQTREHDDLDLVMGVEHVEAAMCAVGEHGFAIVRDERPCSFVMGDAEDRRVDIHPVRFDAEGGGNQAQPNEGNWRYPPEGFTGVGQIGGEPVRCLTPEVQVLCHDRYDLDECDLADMCLLREKFGIELSERFSKVASS